MHVVKEWKKAIFEVKLYHCHLLIYCEKKKKNHIISFIISFILQENVHLFFPNLDAVVIVFFSRYAFRRKLTNNMKEPISYGCFVRNSFDLIYLQSF